MYRVRFSEQHESEVAVTVPGFSGHPAIAVLPFEVLSGDPDQEFLAAGVVEDLVTRLSAWRGFPVIASASTADYKGRSANLKRVSAELGVRYIVQGTVRSAGGQVRINARLIDAPSGQQAWAQHFDGELHDIFALQDEITSGRRPRSGAIGRTGIRRRAPRRWFP